MIHFIGEIGFGKKLCTQRKINPVQLYKFGIMLETRKSSVAFCAEKILRMVKYKSLLDGLHRRTVKLHQGLGVAHTDHGHGSHEVVQEGFARQSRHRDLI